jgi:hypothetical protein
LEKLKQKGFMESKQAATNVLKLGFETAFLPLKIAKDIGSFTLHKAGEIYHGRPKEGPHIVEQIQAEIMVTDAEVGKGLVTVADKLAGQAKAARKKGYSLISRAAIEAETNPAADHDIVQRVINIAQDVNTDPTLLDDTVMSEHERKQAKQIIDP